MRKSGGGGTECGRDGGRGDVGTPAIWKPDRAERGVGRCRVGAQVRDALYGLEEPIVYYEDNILIAID